MGDTASACQMEQGSRLWRVLKYAYYDMIRDIGLRLVIGLVVAALIQVAVPDEFFLQFGSQPLLQILAILITVARSGAGDADGGTCCQPGQHSRGA